MAYIFTAVTMNFLYFDDVIMQDNSNECRINGTAVATL